MGSRHGWENLRSFPTSELTEFSPNLSEGSSELCASHRGASPLQVYVSYDYGKSFKKISERFSFDGGNSSEVAIAQFYHSPADNKRVRGTWQLGLCPCCHRDKDCWGIFMLWPFGVSGHSLGCPWGRGGTSCALVMVRVWWERGKFFSSKVCPPKGSPGMCTFIAASLGSALTFCPVCPSTPSTSLWTPLPRTSGSPPTSATPSKASPSPSEQQTSSCTAGTPTSSWASTGLTLKNR